MSKEPVKIGQLWKLTDTERYYNIGYQDDIIIIEAKVSDVWHIAVFWWSGKPLMKQDGWGGARSHRLYEDEIHEIAEYVGYLPDLLKKGD